MARGGRATVITQPKTAFQPGDSKIVSVNHNFRQINTRKKFKLKTKLTVKLLHTYPLWNGWKASGLGRRTEYVHGWNTLTLYLVMFLFIIMPYTHYRSHLEVWHSIRSASWSVLDSVGTWIRDACGFVPALETSRRKTISSPHLLTRFHVNLVLVCLVCIAIQLIAQLIFNQNSGNGIIGSPSANGFHRERRIIEAKSECKRDFWMGTLR